jgi:hypothetical protein
MLIFFWVLVNKIYIQTCLLVINIIFKEKAKQKFFPFFLCYYLLFETVIKIKIHRIQVQFCFKIIFEN